MNFKRIELEDFNRIKHFLNNAGEDSCESTFINLFVWADYYDNRYCIFDDILFICSQDGGNRRYAIPFCDDKNLEKAVRILTQELYPEKPCFWAQQGARFDKFKELFSEKYVFAEQNNASDYIYLTADLSTLSGKKYHSKRNHITNFSKQFKWQYSAINSSNTEKVKKCAETWYKENQSKDYGDSLSAEREGIFKILDNMDFLGAKGGLVTVNGDVVAFAIGSPINDTVFDVHFEKALADYQGAYAVINREFAKCLADYKFINREDDLGIEGLRKAKLSYNPKRLLKKYLCDPKRYTDKQLAECREIYKTAFGDSGEFDSILFDSLQNNIEILEDGEKVISMLFKLPCNIIKNGVPTEAFYVYALATDKAEQHKGYASKLLEKAYGDGSKVLFLKPSDESLIEFYKQNGYKTVSATAEKNENLYIEVSDIHKKLSAFCNIPVNGYTLMYRNNMSFDINGISFAETLE